ncbi:MAG: PQQ-binding-like beta-propeller repeat protein [Elainella sp. C42_A2020_010]|nr:PQQ-binding-like beta-propeller repeat protein [Elainella sp. C42_A2020_010]
MKRLLKQLSTFCIVAALVSVTPAAHAWPQFHADGANSGFVALRTSPARQPAWSIEVGPVLHASPVVGTDGTVYIGNMNGELSAFNSNGTLRWRRTLPRRGERIMASPSVGQDGNLYVIGTFAAIVRDHRDGRGGIERRVLQSYLHSYDASGNLRWTHTFPEINGQGGFTSAAPKTWSDGQTLYVFVPVLYTYSNQANRYLAVIDQSGAEVGRYYLSTSERSNAVIGVGPNIRGFFADVLGKIWDCVRLSCIEFDVSGLPPVPLPENVGWPHPPVAILDRPPHANQPLVIVDDNEQNLVAYRRSGSCLQEIWRKTDRQPRNASAPSVLLNGLLAVGYSNGFFKVYDPATGNEVARPWPRVDSPIAASPAAFVRQMYTVSQRGRFLAIDNNGSIWKETYLGAESMAAPAMSFNYLYVSDARGLSTFSPTLERVNTYQVEGGGISSPTIAANGTVYLIAGGRLYAFPRNN